MRRAILALVFVIVLAVAGCGSGSDDRAVLSVPPELMASICEGQEDGAGMAPIRAVAVRSEDFEHVYMVAMEFSATGIDPQVGVWATNDLTAGGGTILAVDGFAKQFTVWPDADDTEAGITISADGVEEAKAAL